MNRVRLLTTVGTSLTFLAQPVWRSVTSSQPKSASQQSFQ